jgi:hypothetical protein
MVVKAVEIESGFARLAKAVDGSSIYRNWPVSRLLAGSVAEDEEQFLIVGIFEHRL